MEMAEARRMNYGEHSPNCSFQRTRLPTVHYPFAHSAPLNSALGSRALPFQSDMEKHCVFQFTLVFDQFYCISSRLFVEPDLFSETDFRLGFKRRIVCVTKQKEIEKLEQHRGVE